jgi:hypothetical protein
MHGLRRELLEQQIESIGIPVTTVELPEEPTSQKINWETIIIVIYFF